MEEMRNTYKILDGKSEGKRPLGRHRRKWENNVIMYLCEIWRERVDWIHLAQYKGRWRAAVNAVMKLRVP
jgi:cell wall assembly regulator SMI1